MAPGHHFGKTSLSSAEPQRLWEQRNVSVLPGPRTRIGPDVNRATLCSPGLMTKAGCKISTASTPPVPPSTWRADTDALKRDSENRGKKVTGEAHTGGNCYTRRCTVSCAELVACDIGPIINANPQMPGSRPGAGEITFKRTLRRMSSTDLSSVRDHKAGSDEIEARCQIGGHGSPL